jgi:hypothetical protein
MDVSDPRAGVLAGSQEPARSISFGKRGLLEILGLGLRFERAEIATAGPPFDASDTLVGAILGDA